MRNGSRDTVVGINCSRLVVIDKITQGEVSPVRGRQIERGEKQKQKPWKTKDRRSTFLPDRLGQTVLLVKTATARQTPRQLEQKRETEVTEKVETKEGGKRKLELLYTPISLCESTSFISSFYP